jgi:hypothetical protein
MTHRPFCDSQIHTVENPNGYDCLTRQVEGYNCVCAYGPQNIFCQGERIAVASGRNFAGGLILECHDFEIHPEFLKQIGRPPCDIEKIRALANVPEPERKR